MRRASLLLSLGALASCEVVAGLGDVPDALPTGLMGDASTDVGSADAGTDTPTPPADTGTQDGGTAAMFQGCRIFPPDNPWNRDVSNDPVDMSAMNTVFPNMNPSTELHPDWGDFSTDVTGIPINVGMASPVPVTLSDTMDSDPLACTNGGGAYCYPIPRTLSATRRS